MLRTFYGHHRYVHTRSMSGSHSEEGIYAFWGCALMSPKCGTLALDAGEKEGLYHVVGRRVRRKQAPSPPSPRPPGPPAVGAARRSGRVPGGWTRTQQQTGAEAERALAGRGPRQVRLRPLRPGRGARKRAQRDAERQPSRPRQTGCRGGEGVGWARAMTVTGRPCC